MKYAIPQAQRYELAARIGLFLVGKGLNTWNTWIGRLSKKEQIESFGFYIGKGKITVCGQNDYINMTIKVCFGTDFVNVFYISARSGWIQLDERKAPIFELNLYSSLNNFDEVAA